MYEVTVSRTETITFALDADSPDDALERYLMDGEETESETTETVVQKVREV